MTIPATHAIPNKIKYLKFQNSPQYQTIIVYSEGGSFANWRASLGTEQSVRVSRPRRYLGDPFSLLLSSFDMRSTSESNAAAKTILITGGATGIGFDSARLLLEDDQHRVVLIGRDGAQLKEAARSLEKGPDWISTYECDLSDMNQIQKTAEKIGAQHKNIYGLVNNAGVYPFGGLLNTTLEVWDQAMDVNLRAAFLMTQKVVPLITKNGAGGRIVNISSTAGILPNHFAMAYSVSKAALIQFTRTIAKELGKDGITVNCICPGIVRSPLHEEYHQSTSELEEFYARRGSTFPLGRVGEPRDIAGTVRFLLSDDAAWITGDVLIQDGGRLLL